MPSATSSAGIPWRWLLSWRGLLLLAAAGLILWGAGSLYIQRRDRMLFASARSAIAARDFPSAWFWLQRLYRANPGNIDALRLIAAFEGEQASPEELAWRRRVIQVGPATLQDYLSWAAAALRLGQTSVAFDALARVPRQWTDDPGYRELAGGACLDAGQIQAADDNFSAAVRLDPSDPTHLVNLASIRLMAAGEDVRVSARATLERLAAGAAPRAATRALLDDALRRHDAQRIARFRDALRAMPQHTLEDELACISADSSPQQARARLALVWDGVKADPPRALRVSEWMMREGDSAEALAWLRALPASAQSSIGIQMGEADCLAALRDWTGLESCLAGRNWLNFDCLRMALLVRSARELHAPAPGWSDAIAACHQDGSSLLLLAQTAAGWGWDAESEDLYWRITLLGFPARGPALAALWDHYTAIASTTGLLRVAREQYGDSSSDPAIRNNFAFLSLLSGIASPEVERIAQENFQNQPANPNFAATYAYALYLDGRYQDGLRILGRFGQPRLQAAGASLYLAILQQAAGDDSAASRTAATVNPSKLLPEERLLLQKIGPGPKTSGALQVETEKRV